VDAVLWAPARTSPARISRCAREYVEYVEYVASAGGDPAGVQAR